MLIGYARVSTTDQDLSLQINALKAAGCSKVVTETISGKHRKRPGLSKALKLLSEGDSLVVWKLDRLGRTMKGLIDLAATLEKRGIELKSLTDGIDTKYPAGRFFFNVMAALAVMERELCVERTLAGLAAARQAGRTGGRPKVMTSEKCTEARSLLDSGVSRSEASQRIGVSLSSLYRHIPIKSTLM
ncbi:MAG: recombinase family protein [Dehalococcoidia bacterium]|uniref:recombinase family protein n=1 Tax=unclassified Pseudomonas TaxID=196821 RepID=UPI0014754711|nr:MULTISPECIES: recombinase family protein [unclassified Pseudomonas]NMX92473.1 recombinase family protein [Pseudomonas sp. WS 5086]NMY47249.1 recombinase family protein [Pseudomonas sp. WS 5027]